MTQTRSNAQQVNNSRWFDVLVRVGLVSYGIVHLLIGWLALQIAFGDSSGAPDQQGALQQIAAEPYGEVLLWLIALGLLALAVWQAIEAVYGHQSRDNPKRALKRVASAGKAVIYLVLALSAAKTAMGEQSKSSEDSTTAKLMDLPFGRFLVLAVGLGIIGVGVALVVKGVKKKFERDLDARATSGSSGTAVEKLGQVGYIAKGVSLGVVGGLFVWAAATHDADKAGGLDVALRKLLDTGLGPWLLALVAAGIACFGAFCFAWARYADSQS
ncbi:MAG: DUF1206 domain-containing protein [Actinomycetota bacterium]|nr:DUF1206 domain-containing protein [Actinomycetota bacterium]